MADLQIPGDFDMTSPGIKSFAIVPDDDNDLPVVPKALWINADGQITGVLYHDETPITVTVIAGMPCPLVFKRILATGTDAEFIGILK